jgi:hypothetical protein
VIESVGLIWWEALLIQSLKTKQLDLEIKEETTIFSPNTRLARLPGRSH